MPKLDRTAEVVDIDVAEHGRVTGLWMKAPAERMAFVLAPGAGSNVRAPFTNTLADRFLDHGISTLRYQFPSMERSSRRTDPPPVCHRTVRAAVTAAAQRTSAPLIAGGRSFGGRMTSQAQATEPLPGVRGLVFLSFPLHPGRRPSIERAAHLFKVSLPMLFLQGTRDELADLALLQPVLAQIGERATLKTLAGADHSYHVLARSGRTDAQVIDEIIETIIQWSNER